MIRRAALLALICLLAAPSFSLAAEDGEIQGQVVNKTPGGSGVAGLTVTLNVYIGENQSSTATATTDEEGGFEFQGLATGTEYSYEVTLNYQGADYQSQRVQFEKGITSQFIEVTVWDATTSDEAISVHASQLEIYVEGENLVVVEYDLFVNEGDKTYIGSKLVPALGRNETLHFSLPERIRMEEVELGGALMGCCVQRTPAGFVDTMPFMPGNKMMAFAYKVKYKSPTHLFSTVVGYPTNSLSLLIEDKGFKVTSDDLTQAEPQVRDGTAFLHLFGENLKPDTTLSATISGLPQPGLQQSFKWVALGLLVVALGLGLGYPRLRKQPAAPAAKKLPPEAERRELLLQLARLDDDFEGGKISEQEYRRLRAQTKARLVELSRHLMRKA